MTYFKHLPYRIKIKVAVGIVCIGFVFLAIDGGFDRLIESALSRFGQNFYSDFQSQTSYLGANSNSSYHNSLFSLPSKLPVYAATANSNQTPQISAQAAYVYDTKTGSVLYQKDAQLPLYPASVTKLMTALVAREHYYLDQVISNDMPQSSAGTVIDFSPAEAQTVRSLLKAALIQSGNDAADLLAKHYPGGTASFIEAMNQKAQSLGLHTTYFENPSGLDSALQRMSAQDLALLFEHALQDPFIKETLQQSQTNILDVSGSVSRTLYTTNRLLWAEYVLAGKTGTTFRAGQVLVSLVSIDDQEVILVVMNSKDRYTDTVILYNWVYQTFDWVDQASLNLLH